jgi:PAS domain S-box-containing protein
MLKKILFSFFLIINCIYSLIADEKIQLKIGVYENSPKIFTDEKGQTSGFWADITIYIAHKEDWKIEWIHGSWNDCLQRLENSEIDMMVDVGLTPSRQDRYAFSNETVLMSWSTLYTHKDVKIESILDLKGKTVAGLKRSVNIDGPEGFNEMNEKFDLHCSIIEMSDYIDVFSALDKKEVFAGITNRFFGNKHEKDFEIERTSIIFQPTRLLFAFPKESELTPFLISKIDFHINQLMNDKNSVYYSAMAKHLGGIEKITVHSIWIRIIIVSLSFLIIIFVIINRILKHQIVKKNFQIKKSEKTYQAIFEATGIASFIVNDDFIIMHSNNECEKITGFTATQLFGMNWTKLVYRDDLQMTIKHLKAIKEDSEFISDKKCEIRLINSKGEIKNILLSIEMIPNSKKTIISMVDMTDRKLVEDELQKLSSIVKQTFEGIAVTDLDRTILFVNNAWVKMHEYDTDKELIHKSINIFHSQEQLENELMPFYQKVAEQGFCTGEVGHIRKNCTIFPTITNTTVIKDEHGKPYAIASIVQDITERKQMELVLKKTNEELETKVADRTRDLSEANSRLQELDRLKSMFIASMSHELRTPLNSIIGFTGLILQGISGKIDEEGKKDLNIVYNSSKHLLHLINDVIDISKIEADKFDYYFEEVELNEIIDETISLVSKDVKKKTLELKTEIPPGLSIITDRRRLLQCILNVTNNAVKFTETGIIELKAEKIADVLKIDVKDTGIGIKKEDISKLFKSFIRLESPLKNVTSGTGLGLYLTQKIITCVFHGEICVNSEYGKGSTFTMLIPLTNKIETSTSKN